MRFLGLFDRSGLIAAHRGNRSVRPENTLSALQASVGRCDFIEIDVQLSKDDIPVIIHDETLERTTDVREIDRFAGRQPWRVRDFTLEELRSLDFGSWFYKEDPFGTIEEASVMVPQTGYEPLLTLEHALRFAKEQQLFLNIEIKDMHAFISDSVVVGIVIKSIRQMEVEAYVMLSSFRHAYLPLCKALAPEIPTAALQEKTHPKALISYLESLSVDAYHPDEQILDHQTTLRLRKAGYFVGVFTVNDPQHAQELFSWGVNAVFTDLPELIGKNE